MASQAKTRTFEATLISRELVADETLALRFEKPADWAYVAGQSLDMTLIDPPETDAEGNTRAFSIASAPAENAILIATRLRDTAFKRVLKGMQPGARVKVVGPFGHFRLHDADRPAVMLTGGIGITPFRSILVQAIRDGGLPYRVVLFYANRRPEDAAFLDEIGKLAAVDTNLRSVPTMSKMDTSGRPWNGERGHIDAELLKRHMAGMTKPIYYITGPAGLVKGLQSMLVDSGVDTGDIRTEEFTGY